MSVLAHIGRGIDKHVITAIVTSGLGQRLVEAFREAPGVLSISHHHARGVGTRRVRKGQLHFNECDVVLILVESEQADSLFAAVYESGKVGQPGGGIIFSETVMRGHPLMPFGGTGGTDW